MIVVMKSDTPAEESERIIQEISRWNITPEKSVGQQWRWLRSRLELIP